jgi:low affinity Fe/Cu permease
MAEKTEFETAIERLQALPGEAKADIAPQMNQYLNKLDDLRRAIQIGIESGDPRPGDEVFDELEAKCRQEIEESETHAI